jgi:tetratricopeptide (TPR) repeat protein
MSLIRAKTCFLSTCLALTPLSVWAAEAPLGSFESFRDMGDRAFGQNNYGLAEKNYLAALKVAETEKMPPSDLRWATAYKNLANYYEVRSQFSKCEFYLERELRAREKALGSENPQVIAAVAKLDRFYLAHANQSKADRLTALLNSYAERVLKEEQQLDNHFNEIQKYFKKHGEYAEADKKLKLAKEAADKTRADDHLELAANLDSIAGIYKDNGKFALAEQMYKRSLDLREKALSSGHLALAFGYENLGNLYVAQGKTQEAQPLFRQALDITNKTLDFKRPEVFSRLDNLAKNYISLGQYSEAESLYKHALTLIKENGGSNSKDIGSASAALASLYMKRGRYSEAEPLYKTAVSISEGINGPQSASLAPLLDAYAESLEKSSKSSEASKIRHRAGVIRGNSSACKTTAQSSTDF